MTLRVWISIHAAISLPEENQNLHSKPSSPSCNIKIRKMGAPSELQPPSYRRMSEWNEDQLRLLA
ncbi:hypothetical protein WG66_001927 [Moniliophthora roreri]|nr:hypothetical protein WG66_001927 [Moniliophthora roreri]